MYRYVNEILQNFLFYHMFNLKAVSRIRLKVNVVKVQCFEIDQSVFNKPKNGDKS